MCLYHGEMASDFPTALPLAKFSWAAQTITHGSPNALGLSPPGRHPHLQVILLPAPNILRLTTETYLVHCYFSVPFQGKFVF